MDRSFPLQALAFRGEEVEPPDMNETVNTHYAHRFKGNFNKRSLFSSFFYFALKPLLARLSPSLAY
jgi:hypothetical protein